MKRRLLLHVAVLAAAIVLFGCYLLWVQKAKDTVGPVITVEEGILECRVSDPQEMLLTGVTAWDDRDGDVTASLLVESIYGISEENLTTVTYAAFDRAGNVSKLQRQIRYTDYVGIMMSSITTIINAITYVLIAFVAISLVVSSIMIGVITLISVQERTKEIGILRAVGASKKDISRVFNAETLIVGFTAGALGIGVTLLLNLLVNHIIFTLTSIPNAAGLPPVAGLILVGISMVLTFIAGLIPSRLAAKKDPVVALRTE